MNFTAPLKKEAKEFLCTFIWDEYKSINGIRPRWMNLNPETADDQALIDTYNYLCSEIDSALALEQQQAIMVHMAMAHPNGIVTLDQDSMFSSLEEAIRYRGWDDITYYIPPSPPSVTIGEVV